MNYQQQVITWIYKILNATGTTTGFKALQSKAAALITIINECINYKPTKNNINTNKKNIVALSFPQGKMEGITTISTYCVYNIYCLARIYKYRFNDAIACSNCFSVESGPLNFKNTVKPYIYNSMILSNSIIDLELLPRLNCIVCRLESHGDIINLNHMINYINICRVNPRTKFTLWSKNYNILNKAFNLYGKPENLTVIHSSLELNKNEPDILNKYNFIDKTFTVYNYKYVQDNNIHINCGGRDCGSCDNCYYNAKISPVYITELLKQDAKKHGYINE